MIKQYSTKSAYNSDTTRSTTESTVSLITENNQVIVDGINVIATEDPGNGDVLFLDANGNKVWLKGGNALNKSAIPNDWTLVGYGFSRRGSTIKVLHYDDQTAQWLACWQYAITAISAASITIGLRMKGDYATYVDTTVALTDDSNSYINATTAAEITAALDAAGNTDNVGYDKHGYWAYLADADGNATTDVDDATQIIVQCDFCEHYNQYVCRGTGCTIALCVWGDMPMASSFLKANGKTTNYMGAMNVTRFMTYYGTNGRTPTEAEALGVSGNTTPVTSDAFTSSEYCAALRAAYSTYEEYIRGEFGIVYPQKYSTFALYDGKTMAERYGSATFTSKAGTVAPKFPALNFGASKGFAANADLAVGNWWTADCDDGMEFMDEDMRALIAASQTKMATTVTANNASRWFASRYSVIYARLFYGTIGYLTNNGVYNAFHVSAVTLQKI